MGCDIHCYIEYRQPENSWRDFGGRINPGRNYWMFGAMAGVRTYHIPHIEPRGFPEDAASEAFSDETIYVSETQEEGSCYDGDSITYSVARAEEYVSKGWAHYIPRNSHEKRWVSNSDHHSHSWLTPSEFEMAIAVYLKECGFQVNTPQLEGPSSSALVATDLEQTESLASIREYWAILAALRCFEQQGLESRLVFWFDN